MDKSGISVTIDNTDTFHKIESLIRKVEDPNPLLKIIGKYIQAQTIKMFVGRRPDTSGVRGEKWPKLAKSTVQKKLSLKKSGGVVGNARRPLVETGILKDDLLRAKAIKIKNKGLEFGTDVRNKKGFPYPAVHQTGTKDGHVSKRRWLFLTSEELMHIATITRDWLMGLRNGINTNSQSEWTGRAE